SMSRTRRPARGVSTVLVSAALTLLTLTCAPRALAQPSKLDKATANTAQAMARYRASLEPVQAMYERELARQTDLAEIRQELYDRGQLSAADVQQGHRALVKAQKDVDDIRRQRIEVDRMMVEMRMIEAGKQRPLARGGYEETPGLVRFNGPTPWSLAD